MLQTTCYGMPCQTQRERETTDVEKHVRAITQIYRAIVLNRITAETEYDAELQHLKLAIQMGVWNNTDPILKPHIDAQAELYELENIILRLDKIIPPENLRTKIIQIVHKQGHLGLSKTKEMIRHKILVARQEFTNRRIS